MSSIASDIFKQNAEQQLTVKVEDGVLKISIGVALLAWAVQSQDQWPAEFEVTDLREFAHSMRYRLQKEEEDGTTPVHRMLDKAAQDVLEQGDDGVDEGDVEHGLSYARSYFSKDPRA